MNRPLRLVHISTFYPPFNFGGDGIYVQRLAHALADGGHQVDVIHSVDAYDVLSRGAVHDAHDGHPGVTVHALRGRPRWLAPVLAYATGWPCLVARQIRRVLDAVRPDVIHYHNISLFGPGVLMLAPRGGRCVKVYTTHEHWLVCPTHVLWKFNQRACERPQCLRCVLRAGRLPQPWRLAGLHRWTTARIDGFLSPSRFTATLHAERGFAAPFTSLPLFADRADDDWQRPGPRPHPRPFCLFVGRLEALKGLQTLLAAWDRTSDVDLLIAGAGSHEPALRRLAEGDPRIRFLGQLAPRDLGRYYVHARACVIPSLAPEVFPTVILEAFARKTPVIGRDIGGIPEILRESDGGLVYRTDRELVDAVRALATSEELRAQLGENGYRAFVARWVADAHLPRYVELLRSLARNKLGRVPWEDDPADTSTTGQAVG